MSPYHGAFWVNRRLPGMNEILEMRANVYGRGAKGARANQYSEEKKLIEAEIGWKMAIALRDGDVRKADSAFFTFMFFEPNARRDPDNIMSSCKFIFDAMVKSKILENDSQKHVLGVAHYWTVSKVRVGAFVMIDDERIFSRDEALELAKQKG